MQLKGILDRLSADLEGLGIILTIEDLLEDEVLATISKEGVSCSLFLTDTYASISKSCLGLSLYFHESCPKEEFLLEQENYKIGDLTAEISRVMQSEVFSLKAEIEYLSPV